MLVEFAFESGILPRCGEFQEMARGVAMHAAAAAPSDLVELLTQPFVRDASLTVGDYVRRASNELHERIDVVRFVRWDTDIGAPPDEDPPPKSPAIAMRVVK